jgi:RHS repeat-associated protein
VDFGPFAWGNALLTAQPHGGFLSALQRRSYPRGQYNRFRYYDPAIGRYVSADPQGQAGGVNVFRYARNRPTGVIDPRGENPLALLLTPPGQAALAAAGKACLFLGSAGAAALGIDAAINMMSEAGGDEDDEIPPDVQADIDAEEAALKALKDSLTPPAHPPNPPAPDVDEAQDISESIERKYPDNPQRKSDQRVRDAMKRAADKARGN